MPGTTFNTIVQQQARAKPDGLAYRCGDQLWTFAEVDRTTNRIANALKAAGVGAGDRVAVLTKFHIESTLLTLAAAKLGAVCMPVNWRLAPGEVHYIVDHGMARLMLADRAFLPLVDRAAMPTLQQVLITDGAHDGHAGFHDWYAAASDQFQAVDAQPDDPMLQLYSSGTTGLPKGVVLSHAGLIFNCQLGTLVWDVTADAVVGNALPTFHIAGANMGLFPLFAGATGSSYPDFDPGAFIDAIGRHGITHSFLVPAMILFMLQHPKVKQGDYHTLQLISYGGSPISDRVLTEAMATFQCGFMQVYGLTEIAGSATFLLPEDHAADGPKAKLLRSAGKPVPGARVRIVDPVTLQDLPEGQTGEVLIESPGNMIGYWRNPEATAAAFPEGRNANGGWFRSGDGGSMVDGYVYINDRIKDMIISGGENIYPAEIENTLMKHPAVADGAVIGVPDDTWGESVKACVILRPGATATDREIIDWMRERLAHYKCPKSIDFVDTLPRNPSGKLLKRILRAPYWEGKTRGVNYRRHCSMDDAECLDHTLDLVAQRIGDPAPRVFAQLFAEAPELQALFCNDASGAVRAEMFLRALECLQDAAGAQQFGTGLVAAEHATHLGYGVSTAQFQRFFALVVEVLREAMGPDWTPEIDRAWAGALHRLAQGTTH